MKRLPRLMLLLCVVALVHLPATASACAACMGDVNSKSAPAMNAAIFLMLGCIGFMLSLLAGFGLYLWRRAAAPLPPHAEFASIMNPREDEK